MASTAVFGYFIRHWRYLQLATMVPMVLYLLLVSFVPESPRWLIGQGKVKEAEGILRRIAETNRKELPANFSELLGKLVMKVRLWVTWNDECELGESNELSFTIVGKHHGYEIARSLHRGNLHRFVQNTKDEEKNARTCILLVRLDTGVRWGSLQCWKFVGRLVLVSFFWFYFKWKQWK